MKIEAADQWTKRYGVTWHQGFERGCECWRADMVRFGTIAHIVPTDARQGLEDDWNASLFFKPTLREDHWTVVLGFDFITCVLAVRSAARRNRWA